MSRARFALTWRRRRRRNAPIFSFDTLCEGRIDRPAPCRHLLRQKLQPERPRRLAACCRLPMGQACIIRIDQEAIVSPLCSNPRNSSGASRQAAPPGRWRRLRMTAGLARLATRPNFDGDRRRSNRTGDVRRQLLGTHPVPWRSVSRRSPPRPRASSEASAGSRSKRPPAKRDSTAMLRPSTQPAS